MSKSPITFVPRNATGIEYTCLCKHVIVLPLEGGFGTCPECQKSYNINNNGYRISFTSYVPNSTGTITVNGNNQ